MKVKYLSILVKIAWRNIWRSRLRSGAVVTAVALGLWAGIFVSAFMYGISHQRLNTILRTQLSHIQLHWPGFADNMEPDLLIHDPDSIIAFISQKPAVSGVSGRLITTGMVTSPTTGTGVVIKGVVPEHESQVTDIHEKIIQGTFLGASRKNQIVIGERLAEKLHIKLHAKIVISMQDVHGNIVSGAFRVEGIYKTNSSKYDEANVFILFNDMAMLMGTGGSLHEIAILLHDEAQLEPLSKQLAAVLPDLQVDTWKTLAPELNFINQIMDEYLQIFMTIILLAMAFGIINTMLMAVLERVREIGMLMAIGMNRIKIFLMIMLETILLTFTGVPFGLIMSLLTIHILNKTGVDLSLFARGLASFDIDTIIYPSLDTGFYPALIGMVALTAVLSSVYPALKALQLKPATAIRTI
ncbi:MAG: ABC transporter permease [Chitinophagales bacterium]|nr:MAG: ABC transporter permease [Chitinophagales bacterium]